MERKAFLIAAICLFALMVSLLTGCATVMKGGKSQRVDVRTVPSGVEVYVDGTRSGTSPCELTLSLKNDHSIDFRKEGYQTITVTLNKSLGVSWMMADFALGLPAVLAGLLGVAFTSSGESPSGDLVLSSLVIGLGTVPVLVDAKTGAWNSFDRKALYVTLEKKR